MKKKNQMEKKEIAVICGIWIDAEKQGRWNEKEEPVNWQLIDWIDEWMQYGDCNVPSMHLPYWSFGSYKGLAKKRASRYPQGWGGYNPWADYRPCYGIFEWKNKHLKGQHKRYAERHKLLKDLYYITFDSDYDNDVRWAQNDKWRDCDGIRHIFLLDIWDNREIGRSVSQVAKINGSISPTLYRGASAMTYTRRKRKAMHDVLAPKARQCVKKDALLWIIQWHDSGVNNRDDCDWRFTFLSCLGYVNHAYDYWRHLVNNTVFHPCLYNKAW